MARFSERVDDIGGIFNDKLVRLAKFGPMDWKRWSMSSGKRKTSITRNLVV
jgi:hypothetical protein